MTLAAAVSTIRAMRPNPACFIHQGRGYVDWQFSQVCAYLGFEAGVERAEAMRRWYDYDRKYRGCLLDITYGDYLEAVDQLTQDSLITNPPPAQ